MHVFILFCTTAEEIQNRSSLNLWVALLDGFFDQLPNPIQLKSAFKKAVGQLQQAGYNGKKVFLAGHSLGGKFDLNASLI